MSVAHKKRQRIIDGYLAESGRNVFVPAEFVDWLDARPDHEAYPIFFNQTDIEAAKAHRVDLVRGWVSSLRLTVTVSSLKQRTVNVTVPAFYSPLANRSAGGGYHETNMSDGDCRDEVIAQAVNELRRWHDRWSGVMALGGYNLPDVAMILSDANEAAKAA